ncbi:MAG: dolichol-phosphate mannosyltransferase [Microgenomates group bacterium Gr01-1014_7]|nr:MAG: dolichol-phosphate mannosyltransferase [Microgenomates group bacterium Gr01-1014_7]
MIKDRYWQLPIYEIHEFRKKQTKYCICIPVLNEGEEIKKQLQRMLPFSKQADIVIADWGSTDGSTDPKFLKKIGVRTKLLLKSPGRQGTQLRMGFSYALKQGYEGIIQIDGNNKDGVEAIPNFINALDEGFDYVQGSRFIKGGKAINTPPLRFLAVRLLAAPILSLGAGFWYTDVTNGFRGYSKRYFLHPKVQPFRDIFVRYEFNMYLTVRANQLGLKTKEIPVSRTYPKGKVHTKISFLKGNFDFLLSQLKAAFGYYNPKCSKISKSI